ncbi:amidase family protein [Chitinophagaceae bacterium LB-8]|uniref:Amidase family protein n=1 Tax=Paraflavisolibacter caeni TaxID=2982496 RepID=A0A9X2XVI7_9BACT|nr:amidase family protein [Paraflavisolibacter caeni]MCU7550114.1 amidase family protein [Paraflavisolibacter caeni]
MLEVLMGNQKKNGGTPINDLKIGVVQNFSGNDEIRRAFLKMTEKIKSQGYQMIDVQIPFDKARFDLKDLQKDREAANELLFNHADLLLLPTLNDHVPTIQEAQQKGPQAISPANTFFCNYFGLPAISLPYGKDSNGLPLAFQVAGKPMKDWEVLNVAQSII